MTTLTIPYESLDPLTIGASGDETKVSRETLELDVPEANLLAAIYPDEPEPVADATEAARAALEAPISGQPFSEIVAGASKVAVIIDNQFRPTPQSRLLPAVLDTIEAAGKPARRRLCERQGLPDVRLGHRAEARAREPRPDGAARHRASTRTTRATPRATRTSVSPRAERRCGCTTRWPRAT